MLTNPKAFHHGVRDFENGLPKEIPYSGEDFRDYYKGYELGYRLFMTKIRKQIEEEKKNVQ